MGTVREFSVSPEFKFRVGAGYSELSRCFRQSLRKNAGMVPDTNSRQRVLSATLHSVYFHHSFFCPVPAQYMKAVGEKEKEFNDAINTEV